MLTKEAVSLIQSHLLATTGREWPIATITARPYYKQIWAWWRAQSHFKINDHYEHLEDAPEGINSITVMGETRKMYTWRDGYKLVQEITEDDCRGFYGQ